MANKNRFADRICVITGGSYGIGRAAAEQFLREGGHVVICSRGAKALEQACAELSALSPRVIGHRVDVGDRSQIADFAAAIAQKHGRVDVLVNNAFSQVGGAVADSTDEQWLGNFSVTLNGAFFVTRAMLPLMRSHRHGAIVNLSSVTGTLVLPGTAGYGAAKAGLEQFTRVVAVEEAGHGIRCNAIVVGGVATPALDKLVHGNYEMVSGNVPLKRVAQPSEIAAAIAFLASDEASYITAATLRVDGGLSACMNQSIDQSNYQS